MATEYFTDLNYSLSNEDNYLEYVVAKGLRPQKIVSVCGSGARALSLAALAPSEIHVVDLATQQLRLMKLREECCKQLSLKDYHLLLGYPPYEDHKYASRRKKLYSSLSLPEEIEEFFFHFFKEKSWGPIIYEGNWEKTFKTLARIVRIIMPKESLKISECKTIEEQRKFYEKKFSKWRWNIVLFLLGNKSVFNALLYKGNFVKKNVPESHYRYYKSAFAHNFNNILANSNFFIQLCFFGKLINKETIPIEGQETYYNDMKNVLLSGDIKIEYHEKDIFAALNKVGPNIDFISLSNIPSYLNGEIEENFLQQIRPKLNLGGCVLYRCHLRVPSCNDQGLEDISDQFASEISREKVQVYKIKIYKKVSE